MSNKILGRNCSFLVSVNGQFVPIACSRSFTINTDAEQVETTNAQSGIWRNYRLKRLTWNVDFDGITVINSEATLGLLRTLQFALTPIQMAIIVSDSNGENITYLGFVLPRSLSETFNHNDIVTHTGSLLGSGQLSITNNFNPSSGDVMRIDYTCAGGEVDYSNPLLVNKQILIFEIDGVGYSYVNALPANNKEFTFNAITGVISWSEPKDSGVQIIILYQ